MSKWKKENNWFESILAALSSKDESFSPKTMTVLVVVPTVHSGWRTSLTQGNAVRCCLAIYPEGDPWEDGDEDAGGVHLENEITRVASQVEGREQVGVPSWCDTHRDKLAIPPELLLRFIFLFCEYFVFSPLIYLFIYSLMLSFFMRHHPRCEALIGCLCGDKPSRYLAGTCHADLATGSWQSFSCGSSWAVPATQGTIRWMVSGRHAIFFLIGNQRWWFLTAISEN